MPNGGSDCCGNCSFNRAVQEIGQPEQYQFDEFCRLSNCTLRNLKITNPFWTYCYNFHHRRLQSDIDERTKIRGSVFASGLYEGYVRIPWHGDDEPIVAVRCTCSICGRTKNEGIKVFHEGEYIGFCTNKHYIDWWKTEHDDPMISSEGLKTPEEYTWPFRRWHLKGKSGRVIILPCLDSQEMARACSEALDIPRSRAAELGRSAVIAAERGYYLNQAGHKVDWSALVSNAVSTKQSIPPDASLPDSTGMIQGETRVQVRNETTLMASQRLVARGHRALALNFANGINPGGGFLNGSRAQEEVLCRSSALYNTLVDDPMYEYHRRRPRPDSSDWVIYSPDVPVFRTDDGTPLDQPWLLSFLTSAAPYAPSIGQPESGDLLRKRIFRVLTVASAFGYKSLVLGAWGCGAFENDTDRSARDFREALETDFKRQFTQVVFAITDWSPERRYLGPFRDVFK